MKKSEVWRKWVSLMGIMLVLLGSQVFGQHPPIKKKMTMKDRRAWYKILKWPKEYKEAPMDSYSGLEFYELEPGKYLVEIMCMTGAYQPMQMYQCFETGTQPKKEYPVLRFKRYERKDNGKVTTRFDTEIFGLPTFNPKTKTLEVFTKSLGIGICGSLVTYKFEDGKPVVVKARARSCRDEKWIDPEKWPLVKNP